MLVAAFEAVARVAEQQGARRQQLASMRAAAPKNTGPDERDPVALVGAGVQMTSSTDQSRRSASTRVRRPGGAPSRSRSSIASSSETAIFAKIRSAARPTLLYVMTSRARSKLQEDAL